MKGFRYHPIFGWTGEEELPKVQDDRVEKLATSIRLAVKNHQKRPPVSEKATKKIHALANKFIKGIAHGFAIGDQRSSGYLWGRKSILDVFQRVFDPILLKIFPENSIGRDELLLAGITLPIKEHLYSHKCRDIADRLKCAVKGLEDRIQELPLMEQELISQGEMLEFLAKILYLINQLLPENKIEWCEVCFRRAPSSSKYCDEHHPAKNGTDGPYRKGLRLTEKSRGFFGDWSRYKTIRMVLESNPMLIYQNSHLPQKLASDFLGLIIPQSTRDLVDISLSPTWKVAARKWRDLIATKFPHVHISLVKPVVEYESWPSFVTGLRASLRNPHEDNLHPYWVFIEIIMAEDWITFAAMHADGRISGKKEQILKLREQGISVTEIMKKVDVKKTYVYRIIKTAL